MEQQLRRLNVEAVAARCREESRQDRRAEAGWCFELFRRALDEADQAAWAAVAGQYHLLLLDWAHAARAEPESAEEVAREAIERFWRTLARRDEPVAARFPHVGALLKYLQQCAVCTVLDRRRREQQRSRLDERMRAAPFSAVAPGPEDDTVERVERAERLAAVRRWLAEGVSDQAELRVLALSYGDGLSPAEIARRFPAEFADVEAVRQIKERVLRRARRALSGGR
jgi:RNA polymerase sigma factor (sigma-70 family)